MAETASGANPRRHGLAGLVVALFVVAGLVFSYGLGHAPPARLCTEHVVSATAGAAAAMEWTDHDTPHHGFPSAAGVPKLTTASLASFLASPIKPQPFGPVGTCLCLAVLLTLLVLALAALPRRSGLRLPIRFGWALAPPSGNSSAALSLASLQVLRL